MLRKTLIAIPIVMAAALVTTPAPAPTCTGTTCATQLKSSGSDRPQESISKPFEPPDPCIQFKGRVHERCVTRQMNMNATHGGCVGGGGSEPMLRKAGGAQMEIGTHCLNPQPLPPG